jgi:hypothetical protein
LVLAILTLNLIWDLIKINLGSGLDKQWPWRFNLLDVSTCATLVGIIAGLLLTRAQFSKTMRPAVGWWGLERKKSSHIEDSVWTVFLYNYGPGNCRIKKIEYSYTLVGQSSSGWKPWETVVDDLAAIGIYRSRDYHLVSYSAGFTIPADSARREEEELAAFSKECINKLSSMDISLEVEDALGDTYERIIQCLHNAHKITELRHQNSSGAGRFHRRLQ